MADFNSELATENKDILLIRDKEAIRTSIKNIIMTRKNTLPSDPDFGCNLDTVLFSIMNEITYIYIEEMILLEIEKREPRIEVQEINVEENVDIGQLVVELRYRIILQNEIDSTTIKIDIG